MKKALVIGIFSLGVLFGIPRTIHAERITNFSSDIVIRNDASLLVTENITYDFEGASRHGIFRTIPTRNSDGSFLDIKNISVVDENGNPYTKSITNGSDVTIKIGDADILVSGVKTYSIHYQVQNALVTFDAYDELYWNVTGDKWQVPIDQVSAKISFENTGGTILQSACYQGAYGDTASCSVGNTTSEFTTGQLLSGQGLTVAVGFEKGAVAGITRIGGMINDDAQHNSPMNALLVKIIIVIISGIGLASAIRYRYRMRSFKSKNPVVAWYEPPAGLSPVEMGTLIDKRTGYNDITAGIISLAERGYIVITRTEEKQFLGLTNIEYFFQSTKDTTDITSVIDLEIVNLLFNTTKPVVGNAVALSGISARSGAVALVIHAIKEKSSAFLVGNGYLEKNKKQWIAIWLFIGSIIMVYVITMAILFTSPIIFLLPITGIISAALIGFSSRYTQLGIDTRQQILGFKDFLSVTDKDRFDFHNAPEKNPTLFMKYLPYAIAFGVEGKWAEQFKDITIPNPTWYRGGTAQAFIAADFVAHMNNMGSSFASAATPATSGSGGGGFSGGGSGGGGGGSW